MRNLRIDSLRGLAVILMVFVNCPGSWSFLYPFLKHANREGLFLADLVFPMFLWTLGFSMYLSFEKNHTITHQSKNHKKKYLAKILIKGILLLLFGLGLSYLGNQNLQTLRFPGVLQRIGFLYILFCGLFYLNLNFFKVVVIFVCISIFQVLNLYVNFEHFPEISFVENPLLVESTFSAMVDRMLFGSKHLWIQTKTFDPEGIISSLFSLNTALLGFFYAKVSSVRKQKIQFILVLGLMALCTSFYLPIRKDDWTLSYTLLTTCIVLILYEVFPLFPSKISPFFEIFGRNALLSFLFLGIWGRIPFFRQIQDFIFRNCTYILREEESSFLFSVLLLALLFLILWIQERIRDLHFPRQSLKT